MSNISLSSQLEKLQKHFHQEIINNRLILCPIEHSQKNGKQRKSLLNTVLSNNLKRYKNTF